MWIKYFVKYEFYKKEFITTIKYLIEALIYFMVLKSANV